MRTTMRAVAVAGAVVFSAALAACTKKNEGAVVDTTAAGIQTATVSVDTTPIRVSDIQVGKSVGADKKVANQTTTFGVRDTMFVAVVTDGAGKGAKLATKWTYNGKTVKEDSQTISPTGGTTVSNFQIDKKTAWPKGKYTVEVMLNGTSAGTKDIEVK